MDTPILNVVTITERIAKARELQRQIEALDNDISALEEPIHDRIRALIGHESRYGHSDGFSIVGDELHFTATFQYESDERYERSIPLQFITEPDVNVAKQDYQVWLKEQGRLAAERAKVRYKAECEAKERAEFERLRAKFETNTLNTPTT